MTLTRAQRVAVGCIAAGAVVIAAIGFTGSYTAVQGLAARKGFGFFSFVFPVGVDVGIGVLLALDLLLTWLRIPFPLLRQVAWLLTAATILFNAASAWPDALAVAMHAIIPVLFVVVVEAGRHAVGRLADISVDKHMESVRLVRWILSPLPTFRLWRRMKLWELRSYEQVVQLEQNRVVYRTRLRATYGRGWRRLAPVELLLPLKLARYGVPLPALPTSTAMTAVETLSAQAPAEGSATTGEHTVALPPELAEISANLAEFPAVAEDDAGNGSNLDPFPGAAEAEPVPVEAVTQPLLTSERTDLDFEVPDLPAEAFLTWLDEQIEITAAAETEDPQAAAESTDPEPLEPAQVRASKLAAGQDARLERLRQGRQDAAEAWWQQVAGGTTPSYGEHARAYGMSAPTLRKALIEFPEPVPEAAT